MGDGAFGAGFKKEVPFHIYIELGQTLS